MTSKERKEARYQRRKAKRDVKKQALLQAHDFEKVAGLNELGEAAMLAARGVSWKAPVQKYKMNLMTNTYKTHMDLMNGVDIRRGFNQFYIVERGKKRFIQAVHFSERVVQKSLCRNALIPVMTRSLIYDNGASQEGKGTHFALKRMKKHLIRHYRHHGREGGILLIDLHDFFASVSHEKLKELYLSKFTDKRLLNLTFSLIDAFDKGLGLGSEVSQISAVAYPDKIDHYIKEVLRIKGYGRFVDDSYLIHEDVGFLRVCLEKIAAMYKDLGIELNRKKTRICDLKHGFSFLKTRFFITKTGHIIMKACREAIVRERRELKKHAEMLKNCILAFEDARTSYASWRGSMIHKDAHRAIQNMDGLFNKLFITDWILKERSLNYG